MNLDHHRHPTTTATAAIIPALPTIVALLALTAAAPRGWAGAAPGIDALRDDGFAALKGKRVGLITNQTGVDHRGTKTRVILHEADGVNLVALFTPEHGLDGTEKAGGYVASRRDPLTGLMAHSLYGPTRKPSAKMLAGLDALVYDMQDIGCRSYTYISTMVKCMEAAGEQGLEFVVLDRPNPLGGERIEGPPMESRWLSFVGPLPVPYVHGMTAGELARMANAKGWTGARCKLTVIPARGWQRSMTWGDTGLPWVKPSPNIPHERSPLYYVATGLIGELAGIETGVGGPTPFEVAGATGVDAKTFTAKMRALGLPGVGFSEFRDGGFGGSRLKIDPHSPADLTGLGIQILAEINRQRRADLFSISPKSKLDLFYKCYGSTDGRALLEKGVAPEKIIAGWGSSVARFRAERQPFLLY